jgi:hypothetical protein
MFYATLFSAFKPVQFLIAPLLKVNKLKFRPWHSKKFSINSYSILMHSSVIG